jgi:signal transduction histidine kinase/HAMP domain-containing protein
MISVNGQVKGMLLEVRGWLLVLVIAGVAAAGFVVATAITSILHQLQTLTRSAQQIEGGNLDLSLDVLSRDEIGQLAEAFNSMTSKLREFRRLDHDRLVRTQQTTQLAIDSLPDAVFIVGPQGEIEVSNRAASKHFGIDPGVTIEKLAQKLKWLRPLYESARDTHAQEAPAGYRSAIQLFDDGNERFLLPRAVPMIGLEGKAIGECVILVDVTHLRSADEAKSNVVSTVSHELRTPLTSIRMALKMLSGNQFGPLSPKQTKLLVAAREDSDRLYRIIENLLNISRIESGRVEFQFRPMLARDIVSLAADPMRSAFSERNIELDIDLPADLPRVRVDPVVITSALSNLLSNALKFTPPGGRVSVTATADEAQVSFAISDTGPGIPVEFRSRIFEKFFRVPMSAGPSGAGLGLSITKDIIEAHGGQIGFDCPDTGGTIFRFQIPLDRSASTGSSVAAATKDSAMSDAILDPQG